jgi:hypothetical protein
VQGLDPSAPALGRYTFDPTVPTPQDYLHATVVDIRPTARYLLCMEETTEVSYFLAGFAGLGYCDAICPIASLNVMERSSIAHNYSEHAHVADVA